MAEFELPSDSSILTALYPEEAKRIAQVETLRQGVRRPQGGGLLARQRERERAAQLQGGGAPPAPQRTGLIPGGTPQAQRPMGPGGMPNFGNVATGMPDFGDVSKGSGPPAPTGPRPGPGLMPQNVPGLGSVGGAPGGQQQIPGLGSVPTPNPAAAGGPLKRATGRAGAPAPVGQGDGVPPGQPSSHEPADGPESAKIDPKEDWYRQAEDLRRRAYNLAPDPEVMSQERQKAGENFFAGSMLQALGGRAFGQQGGAVLQQALKRQGELELDPEKELSRKIRALDAEATAMERRAERTQLAEDKREAERLRIEQRQWEAKENAANRMAQIQASIAGRAPSDPMVQVADPNDPTKGMWVPRSQAAGMQTAPKGGAGANAGKLSSEQQRMMVGLGTAERSLNEYEALLKNYGARSLDQINPVERAKIASVHARILMEGKEMFQLGALAKEDLAAMEKILTDPTGWRGISYGNKGLSEQVESMRRHLKIRREEVGRAGAPAGAPGAPAAAGAAPGAPAPIKFSDLG